MKLVDNEEKYYDYVRVLRTHKDNINGFLEHVEITPEQQKKYMDKYKNNYYICLDKDNNPIGWVGEVDEDIRICVDPKEKGKGVGKFMLNELSKIKPNAHAKVLLNNEASHKLFLSCGYSVYKTDYNFKYYKYGIQ